MSVDIFLKVDGIDGSSMDDKHKNEIDVLSWGWGATQSGTTHMGPGAGSGKVSVSDMTFTKYVDKATHNLIKCCMSGKHIANAKLVVRKAGGDTPVEFLKIEMKEIIVSSYNTGGASDGLDRVEEHVTFNFREVKVEYTEQTADGAAGASSSAGWDIAANKAV
nr:type VI secretion system tube protein Hcp [uncultured Cohaesibacter sp.]